MKIHHLAIGVLVVSFVMIGAMSFISNMAFQYGTTADLSAFNNSEVRLEKQQNISNQLEGKLNFTLEKKPSDLFILPYRLIQVGWSMGELMFQSWATGIGIVSDSTTSFTDSTGQALPKGLVGVIQAILIIILVAIVMFAFFKWKWED